MSLDYKNSSFMMLFFLGFILICPQFSYADDRVWADIPLYQYSDVNKRPIIILKGMGIKKLDQGKYQIQLAFSNSKISYVNLRGYIVSFFDSLGYEHQFKIEKTLYDTKCIDGNLSDKVCKVDLIGKVVGSDGDIYKSYSVRVSYRDEQYGMENSYVFKADMPDLEAQVILARSVQNKVVYKLNITNGLDANINANIALSSKRFSLDSGQVPNVEFGPHNTKEINFYSQMTLPADMECQDNIVITYAVERGKKIQKTLLVPICSQLGEGGYSTHISSELIDTTSDYHGDLKVESGIEIKGMGIKSLGQGEHRIHLLLAHKKPYYATLENYVVNLIDSNNQKHLLNIESPQYDGQCFAGDLSNKACKVKLTGNVADDYNGTYKSYTVEVYYTDESRGSNSNILLKADMPVLEVERQDLEMSAPGSGIYKLRLRNKSGKNINAFVASSSPVFGLSVKQAANINFGPGGEQEVNFHIQTAEVAKVGYEGSVSVTYVVDGGSGELKTFSIPIVIEGSENVAWYNNYGWYIAGTGVVVMAGVYLYLKNRGAVPVVLPLLPDDGGGYDPPGDDGGDDPGPPPPAYPYNLRPDRHPRIFGQQTSYLDMARGNTFSP